MCCDECKQCGQTTATDKTNGKNTHDKKCRVKPVLRLRITNDPLEYSLSPLLEGLDSVPHFTAGFSHLLLMQG